jgi:aminopeptidase N
MKLERKKMGTQKAQKKPKLTPTQAKVVRAKIKAELNDIPQRVTSREVWPNASPEAASVMMSRELKKDNVQEALQIALAKYGLTPDTIAASVGSAMGAYKTVAVEGNLVETEVPDHSIRLKAAGMAAQWMGVGKVEGNGQTNNSIIFNINPKKADN